MGGITMAQDLNALLLALKDDPTQTEALTSLLYQLGATGCPELTELTFWARRSRENFFTLDF